VDQPGGGAALLLALLWERNQRVLYVPGLSVDRARDVYRGESKTYARDAYVIAEQARMRSDLSQLRLDEQEIAELQLLTSRSVSAPSTRSSSNVFSPVRRLGFSLACQGWVRSSGPSSW
jgi:hypothetical protein